MDKLMKSLNEKIVLWAQAGAVINSSCGKMCKDCIFKTGTYPNNDQDAVMDAADCLWIDDRTYHCAHTGKPEGEEDVCAGYLYARQYFESKFKKS